MKDERTSERTSKVDGIDHWEDGSCDMLVSVCGLCREIVEMMFDGSWLRSCRTTGVSMISKTC